MNFTLWAAVLCAHAHTYETMKMSKRRNKCPLLLLLHQHVRSCWSEAASINIDSSDIEPNWVAILFRFHLANVCWRPNCSQYVRIVSFQLHKNMHAFLSIVLVVNECICLQIKQSRYWFSNKEISNGQVFGLDRKFFQFLYY